MCCDLIGEEDLAVECVSWIKLPSVILNARVELPAASVREAIAGWGPSGVEGERNFVDS